MKIKDRVMSQGFKPRGKGTDPPLAPTPGCWLWETHVGPLPSKLREPTHVLSDSVPSTVTKWRHVCKASNRKSCHTKASACPQQSTLPHSSVSAPLGPCTWAVADGVTRSHCHGQCVLSTWSVLRIRYRIPRPPLARGSWDSETSDNLSRVTQQATQRACPTPEQPVCPRGPWAQQASCRGVRAWAWVPSCYSRPGSPSGFHA